MVTSGIQGSAFFYHSSDSIYYRIYIFSAFADVINGIFIAFQRMGHLSKWTNGISGEQVAKIATVNLQ